MLVIDIFNSRRGILEIGIINTSKNPCCGGIEETNNCINNTYIYEYGIIKDGKIPNILGYVVHKQSDCGLKLVQSVISEMKNKELLNFKEKVFSHYLINISVNRKKLIENIIVKKNKSGYFDLGFKSLNGLNKIDIFIGTINLDNNYIGFLNEIFTKVINFNNIFDILEKREKQREYKKMMIMLDAVNNLSSL